MSFQKNYQEEMNRITADESVKSHIRGRLKKEEVSLKKGLRIPLLRAAAFAFCTLLACGTGLWAISKTKEVPPAKRLAKTTALAAKADYKTIYKTIKSLTPKGYGFTTGKYFVTEEAAEDAAPSAKNAEIASNEDYSGTTKQVENVDEADIVKTDGKYIYRLSVNYRDDPLTLAIVDAQGAEPKLACSFTLPSPKDYRYETMYVTGDRLVLIGHDYRDPSCVRTAIAFYDISDRTKPTLITENLQCGGMTDSRMIGDKLYLISNHFIGGTVREDDPRTYVPFVECGDEEKIAPADSICIYEHCQEPCFTVVCGYTAKDGALLDTKSVLGGSFAVYCNTETIVTAGYDANGETPLFRFGMEKDAITLMAEGKIAGSLLNQFSMDEYKGCFRFVTTDFDQKTRQTQNALTILDGDFKQIGKIDNIAPGERVYSVRFMGDIGYFVTFRQVDPLFSVDLSDPRNPKIIGTLKIPGFSDYLFPYGEGKLLGIGRNADEETGRAGMMKLSLFDISDPANVTEQFKADVPAFDSEALYNHKACLADGEKNLIGFSANYENPVYYLFTLKKDSFSLLANIPLNEKEPWRGLYIGNTFYLVGNETLLSFPLSEPNDIREFSLK